MRVSLITPTELKVATDHRADAIPLIPFVQPIERELPRLE